MTDYTGIHASQVHTRCRYGNVPPSLMTWHDQSHCRGEFPRVKQAQVYIGGNGWVSIHGVDKLLYHFHPEMAAQDNGATKEAYPYAAPEPLAVLTARRERVLAGLMAEWAKRAGPAFRASTMPTATKTERSL